MPIFTVITVTTTATIVTMMTIVTIIIVAYITLILSAIIISSSYFPSVRQFTCIIPVGGTATDNAACYLIRGAL